MKLNHIRIAAFASVASISLLSALASAAPAGDAKARGSEMAAPMAKTDAIASAADQRMLPLAGVTQGQAMSTWQKLASRNNLAFSDKDAEEGIRQLSSDSIDCDRLGLLCPLVGKERVPGIIRATWQAELRTADFNETMAAFDKSVSAAAQENARDAMRTGDQVEADFAKAVGDKSLDPKNERQVAAFAANHPHSGAAFKSWLDRYVTHSAGAKIVCNSTSWSYTGSWNPGNWKFRRLADCGGDVWGELTTHFWGYSWTGGVATVSSVSTYFRTPCYCWPTNATTLTTSQTFKSSPAQSNSNSSFIVSKTHVYTYSPPKNGTYSASSNESNVVALSLGPNALSF